MHPASGIGPPCSQPVRIYKAGKANSTVQNHSHGPLQCCRCRRLTFAYLTAIDYCGTHNTLKPTLKAKSYKPFVGGSQLFCSEKSGALVAIPRLRICEKGLKPFAFRV
ncbi:TPA: hypothetical protein ACH3X2_004417 [Trebouxia sp. C0005]